MDAAYLSALSALAGSVVGGLTMALSAWISQSVSARAGMISSQLGAAARALPRLHRLGLEGVWRGAHVERAEDP